MKVIFFKSFFIFLLVFTLFSCSSESSDSGSKNIEVISQKNKTTNYTYNSLEIETLNLINDYRAKIGLNALVQNNYISLKSEEHNDYMITNNVVNHNGFETRSENILKVLGAIKVAENIAYNYNSPQNALEGWLKSPTHKANIEGNFTFFGLSIRVNAEGRKYYTNIFAKM